MCKFFLNKNQTTTLLFVKGVEVYSMAGVVQFVIDFPRYFPSSLQVPKYDDIVKVLGMNFINFNNIYLNMDHSEGYFIFSLHVYSTYTGISNSFGTSDSWSKPLILFFLFHYPGNRVLPCIISCISINLSDAIQNSHISQFSFVQLMCF